MKDNNSTQDIEQQLKRLENNLYALNKAYQRLQKAIDLNHEQEIYTAIGETLLWTMTTNEWHQSHNPQYKRRRNKDENGQLLFGLLHAYNSMKHNMEFITIHTNEGGVQFPISFPLEIPPISVHWMPAGEILDGGGYKQKENYKRYIEGKDVLDSFKLAMDFLQSEYNNICK
ncbi:hypothetical protein [Cytobacillus sp. IB215316]|uniref:hypothetical protein n=1 Tax=Cytobacillus sp. IB215316 TaxID=3097354 RepID=UPI002A10C36E|nr:hypothetical protein [Cytobacillus sp. IB215316]MDX8359834.1 hypothetical protein [Cytobacillus sp. IB215316]